MMLGTSQKQSYWKQVQTALEIAGAPIELVDSLLQTVQKLPEDQQELFYHAEPLDVARDLSGVERWTDEQVRTYIEQSNRESKSDSQLEIPITAGESERKRFSFLSILFIVLALTFGALVLGIVSLQQTSPLAPILSILAAGVAALTLVGALMLGMGLPIYKNTMTLEKKLQRLEAQNQRLEEWVTEVLEQNQRFEKETKEALGLNATPSRNPRFLRIDD